MNVTELKEKARELGIDLLGVAPRSRWENLPASQNPLSIMPECQSVVVVARKILRGVFRSVEEGTSFNNTYGIYGRSWHEFEFLSRITFNLANVLEATGAEAIPMTGGTPAEDNGVKNTVIDAKAMAHLAGLGSIGKGGFFLTPQYGLRQRIAFILTDAVLDGDPIQEVTLCDGCNACMEACPLNAYVNGKLNTKYCDVCQNGKQNGGVSSFEPLDRLAASCGRACLVATEDKIEEKFHSKFRKRAIWTRDIEGNPTVTPLSEEGGK